MDLTASDNLNLKHLSIFFIDQGSLLKGEMSGEMDVSLENEIKQSAVDKKWDILCAQCAQIITDDSERIAVNGEHEHTFANPHGIIFQIGCFANASGCVFLGEETEQWSWFKGYSWKIVSCAGCGAHLGWVFMKSGKITFYGLILNRLLRLN